MAGQGRAEKMSGPSEIEQLPTKYNVLIGNITRIMPPGQAPAARLADHIAVSQGAAQSRLAGSVLACRLDHLVHDDEFLARGVVAGAFGFGGFDLLPVAEADDVEAPGCG